jgi:hypothetical protein
MTLVSDGCIAHVSLRLKTNEVRAAHDGEVYRLIRKANAARSRPEMMRHLAQEEIEHEKMKVAQEAIVELARIGLRTLLCMEALPTMIAPDSQLELRLLLCRLEAQ